MTNCEQYLEYQKKWSNARWSGNEQEYEMYCEKAKKLRDNFSKQDYEQLIAQSHGRAKFEYTKLMKEKFPD